MDYTILINKNNKLSPTYVPSDLIATDNNENNFHKYKDPSAVPQISEYIYPFFLKMQENAAKAGVYIIVDSGYRSYDYQKIIWDKNVEERGLEETEKLVAVPGSSEHQSGLAFDVAYIRNGEYSDNVQESDKETQWLFKNAYKYGFIVRYPKGKEAITGYKFEPWHFRFVGLELASVLYAEGITLEEYYERIRKNNDLTAKP